MQTAYISLVKTAINFGFTVSVWDGEEWMVKKSTKLRQICEAIKAVEGAELRFRDQENKVNGWAMVTAYGVEADETVIDFTDNAWMNAWFEASIEA